MHEWTATQPGAVWDGVSEGTRLIRAGVPLETSPANARAAAVTATEANKELDADVTASLNVSDELDRKISELVKQVNVELNTYLFKPGTFTPLAKFTPTRQLSVFLDHLGTPAALYDGAGELVWQNRMDIYGRPLWTDGLAADMWFRYPGQYEDNETGLSYNRFRYYDAGVGCYISRDPVGLAGGNPTLYGYVGDVNGETDVFGLQTCKHFAKGKTITDRWVDRLTGKTDADVHDHLTSKGWKKTQPQMGNPEKIQHIVYEKTTKAGDTYKLDYHPGSVGAQANLHGTDYWKVYKRDNGKDVVYGRITPENFVNYDKIVDSPVYINKVLVNAPI